MNKLQLLDLLYCYENIPIFFVNSAGLLLPCLQISLPFAGESYIICLSTTSWNLLSEPNNKRYIGHFQGSSHMHIVGVICLTPLLSAQKPQCRRRCGGKMSSGSQVISIEVLTHVIEQPSSLSAGEPDTWMATQILALILELIDSHQSCWARCITFPGSLKSPFSPSFFFKLDMLCWRSVSLRGEMRAVDFFQSQLLKHSRLHCDASASFLSGCDSLRRWGCNLR